MSEELKAGEERKKLDTGEEPENEAEREMTLTDHLGELRDRLIKCFAAVMIGFLVSFSVSKHLWKWLFQPIRDALPPGSNIIATKITEQFFNDMKISFVIGLLISSPFVFYQIWRFIAPGLYDEEKKGVIPAAVASAVCFIFGAFFGFKFVLPVGIKFLLNYAETTVMPMPTFEDSIDFILKFVLAFGAIFEMPLFILILSRMGLVTSAWLKEKRKYAIIFSFIIGAILTPGPDVFSQLMMAIPMCLLYESGIIIARLFGKEARKKAEEKSEAPA